MDQSQLLKWIYSYISMEVHISACKCLLLLMDCKVKLANLFSVDVDIFELSVLHSFINKPLVTGMDKYSNMGKSSHVH